MGEQWILDLRVVLPDRPLLLLLRVQVCATGNHREKQNRELQNHILYAKTWRGMLAPAHGVSEQWSISGLRKWACLPMVICVSSSPCCCNCNTSRELPCQKEHGRCYLPAKQPAKSTHKTQIFPLGLPRQCGSFVRVEESLTPFGFLKSGCQSNGWGKVRQEIWLPLKVLW